jgi:hypothetical protein
MCHHPTGPRPVCNPKPEPRAIQARSGKESRRSALGCSGSMPVGDGGPPPPEVLGLRAWTPNLSPCLSTGPRTLNLSPYPIAERPRCMGRTGMSALLHPFDPCPSTPNLSPYLLCEAPFIRVHPRLNSGPPCVSRYRPSRNGSGARGGQECPRSFIPSIRVRRWPSVVTVLRFSRVRSRGRGGWVTAHPFGLVGVGRALLSSPRDSLRLRASPQR